MLPLTPNICPASLWFAQQVKQMADLCVGVSLGSSTRGYVFLRLPGLVYPKETKFINQLRNMEQSQQEEQIALIPSTIQQLEEMLVLCCYNWPRLPRQVLSRPVFRASPVTAASAAFAEAIFALVLGYTHFCVSAFIHSAKEPEQEHRRLSVLH